jgi:hypothetical protein
MANPPLPMIASNTEETAFAVLEGNEILEQLNVSILDMSKKMTTSIGHLTGAFMSFSEMIKEQNAAVLAKLSLAADGNADAVGPSGATPTGTPEEAKKKADVAMKGIWETIKSLGFWGGAIAGGLVIGAGLILGQIENIKTYGRLIGNVGTIISDVFKAITPDFIKTPFTNFKNYMSLSLGQFTEFLTETFSTIKDKFSKFGTYIDEVVAGIRTSMTSGFEKFKAFFTFAEDSNVGKTLGSIRVAIDDFLQPFKSAITTLMGLAAPEGSAGKIATFASDIFGHLGKFGTMFSGIATTLGKVFAPILILTTAFETIKSAIDGYAEGGIIGGLKGAIDGLFNALIGAPLKMLTDAVAWVLGKLGFDEASDAVSSFDPTALWKKMTSAIFGGIESAIEWIKGFFVWSPEGETEEGPGFITTLVTDAWESVKKWFSDALAGIADALPSWDDITSGIISTLPSWMVPDSYKTPQMRADAIEKKIAQTQADIEENSLMSVGLSSADEKQELAELLAEQSRILAEIAATGNKGTGDTTIVTTNNNNSSGGGSSSPPLVIREGQPVGGSSAYLATGRPGF